MLETKMKPIWYFVGLILLIIGGIIFITGIYSLIVPPSRVTTLSELHPDIWWCAVMAAFGGFMYWKTRKENA